MIASTGATVHRWYHHALAAAGIGLVLAVIIGLLMVASAVKDHFSPANALRTLGGSQQQAPVRLDSTGLVQAAQRLGAAADALAAAKGQASIPPPPPVRMTVKRSFTDRVLGRHKPPKGLPGGPTPPRPGGVASGALEGQAGGAPSGSGRAPEPLPPSDEPRPRDSIARMLTEREQVIDLSAKDAADRERKYGLAPDTLSGRHRGGRNMLTEAKLKPAPQGGEVLVTQNQLGVTEVIEKPAARGFLGFGGLRAAGVEGDYFKKRVSVYWRQDFLRIGAVVIGVRLAGSYEWSRGPAPTTAYDYAAPVTAEVRF